MQLSGCLLLALASSASAFQNTAPLLVSSDRFESPLSYFTDISSSNIVESLNALTQDICSSSSESLLLLKINGLTGVELSKELVEKFASSNSYAISHHVLYQDISATELTISPSCSINKFTIESSDKEWVEKLSVSINDDNLVQVITIDNDDSLLDSLEQLSILYQPSNLIIQGLPTFKTPSSILNQASKYFKKVSKRHSNDVNVDESDFDTIEQELKDAFEEIEDLITDETFTVNEDGENKSPEKMISQSDSNFTVDGSLFDKYGFFSTGIWMATIVSLFLVWVILVALSWLNSLKVSYKAFDKPYTGAKKFQ